MTFEHSLFLMCVVAMVAIGILFVVLPIYKFTRESTNKGIKSTWYRSRLKELEEELAAGQFSEEEFAEAVKELKITATSELKVESREGDSDSSASQDNSNSASTIKPYLIAATVLFVIAVGVSYHLYGERTKLVDWQATLERMPELSQQVLSNTAAEPSEKDLKDFALGLRSKLHKEPNAIGWMLLGRNLNMLRDIDGAIDAFDKSLRMDSNSVSTMVSMAQALQERGEPGDYRRSIRVLKNALRLNPQNLTALILLAEGEMLDEQFDSALQGFKLVNRVIGNDDPRRVAVEQRIAFLADKLGLTDGSLIGSSAESSGSENSADGQLASDQMIETEQGAYVNIKVELDPSVRLEGFSHLFVFAKSPSMPMPLAVKKIAVSPTLFQGEGLMVTLTEQDVMMPSLSLSSQSSVDIFARLSVDETAPYQPGDIQDSQSGVTVNKQENRSEQDTVTTLRLATAAQTEEGK